MTNGAAEQEIVRAARNGDAESFGVLYARHYATMLWLAYSILLDRDLAEDTAQQTFVKACEKLADLKRLDCFGAWLAAICRNEAHQLFRARQRAVPMPEEVECAEAPQTGHDRQDAVKAAVAQLAPMYREIVILHYYSRMDYRQIASTLGIAGHTVRGRLFRARRQIEQILKRNGFPKRQ
ncbi:MAG: sigma-70 family RNA polymerase sigma factor [Sedimentisphaerales bacterium]|nr:sigma-70 family RNA polymerase sigma factor [Sedimentisphaerales bacterium]